MNVFPNFENAVRELLDELESNRLEVGLIPCRRECNVGGMIRVTLSQNAKWYRDFCANYPSTRRRKKSAFDTKIKRANIVAALNSILRGETRSVYASHLLRIARERFRGPSSLDLRIQKIRRSL